MKWFIVNQQSAVGQLYWSDARGMWGSKRKATVFSAEDFLRKMPLCYRGARWVQEEKLS